MSPDRGRLRHVLGLGFAVSAVVGGSIGAGILRSPGPIAAALPDPTLILLAWVAGGLLQAIEALPLIEASTALPRAGGPIVYVERAYGRRAGALIGWANVVQCAVSVAFLTVVGAEYAQRLGLLPGWSTGALASMIVAALTALNLASTRVSGDAQITGTAIKLGALLLLAGGLFALAPAAAPSPLPPDAIRPAGVALALLLVTNTYIGWGAAIYFAEEYVRPARTLILALPIGIGLLTLVYVGLNAALLHALPVAALGRSSLAAADAVAVIAGPAGERAVTAVALVSVLTLANITMLLPSRTLYAMAASGTLPPLFAAVGARGVPWVAVLASAALTVPLAASGGFVALNAVFGPIATLTAIVMTLAIMRLRRTEPDLPRPFRIPLYPLPMLVTLAANLALLAAFVAADPVHAGWSLALLALAVPMLRRRGARP